MSTQRDELAAIICDAIILAPGANPERVTSLSFAIASAVLPFIERAKAEALLDAADAWQQGEWADAPRRNDRVQERIANGQYVTDWLRDRAAEIEKGIGR